VVPLGYHLSPNVNIILNNYSYASHCVLSMVTIFDFLIHRLPWVLCKKDPPRCPLPKHCVVFVAGPYTTSRARCTAARLAGMRIMYIERKGIGNCDSEDLVDGVISGFGNDSTESLLTIDDIATPGSFWLNPPSPRYAIRRYYCIDFFSKFCAFVYVCTPLLSLHTYTRNNANFMKEM
jgi:hypothetical protein